MKFEQCDVYSHRHPGLRFGVDSTREDVWAIGDVHGCGEEFYELCQNIKEETPNCKIIQLGDLIDRGPHLLDVFETVDKFGIELCIGNHELNFLLEHDGYKKCNSNARQKSHQIFDCLSSAQKQFILDMMRSSHNVITVEFLDTKSVYEPPERWFLSHAPIENFEEVYVSDKELMTNAWTFCSGNQPYDGVKLYSNNFFAHGHQHWNYTSIFEQIKEYKNCKRDVMNLDGGCVYGGELVAYNICKNRAMVVKAKETYYKY